MMSYKHIVLFHKIYNMGEHSMLHISTSVWVLRTPNAIVIFSIFNSKKLKKARNLQQNLAKITFFKFAPKRWSTVLFPKNELFPCFEQRLECAAPKGWSEYTTPGDQGAIGKKD